MYFKILREGRFLKLILIFSTIYRTRTDLKFSTFRSHEGLLLICHMKSIMVFGHFRNSKSLVHIYVSFLFTNEGSPVGHATFQSCWNDTGAMVSISMHFRVNKVENCPSLKSQYSKLKDVLVYLLNLSLLGRKSEITETVL